MEMKIVADQVVKPASLREASTDADKVILGGRKKMAGLGEPQEFELSSAIPRQFPGRA